MSSPAPAFADLHLLTVLAALRSYTKAAGRLGISKATVSLRIAELERAAGVPLVRRTTRSVSLTAAGQQLVSDTEGAFDRITHSFDAIRELAGAPRGLVRVTAPVALGRQHVAAAICDFLRLYPDIRVDLDLNDRLVNLTQEGFDLAIRHAQAPLDTHVAWTLCESRSVLVAHRDYLRRQGEPGHPSELARHHCLLYLRDPGTSIWDFERELRRKFERVQVSVTGSFRANNSEVLREAVLAGLGIGMLPEFSASPHLGQGRLIQVLPQWKPLGFFGERIFAMRPWSPQVPQAVRLLVEHLRARLTGASWRESEKGKSR